MKTDGSVIFKTKIDNSQSEKDLMNLVKKIENIERDISGKQIQRSKWVQSAEAVIAPLEEAKAKLYEMQSAANGTFSAEKISDQKDEVKNLQSQWDYAQNQVDKYDRQIESANIKLNQTKTEAAELADKIEQANTIQNKFNRSVDDSGKRFDKLLSRAANLASRVFVFSILTAGLRSLREWLGNVITSNDEASAALARLKGALLTMVQPLISVVIPAFTTLVNLLTAIIGKIAAFISALGGKTVKQSADAAKALNKQAKAIGGVGSAAEEAQRQLMGFDEINKLSDDSANAGGGGGGSTVNQPDFNWTDGISERLEHIADLVLLIGAGLALWKIGSMIPGVLGDILSKLGLIVATIGFLLLAWDGVKDAWENGVDWGNMAEMILGVAGAATALYLAFGNIAAGIVLVVGGAALLITAFHDIMKNGFNLQNTLLAIAGIMAAGLGISLLTGSWIPLLIAGIAGVLLALTVATGHGGELINGLRQVCGGFIDFIAGVFSGDWDRAWSGIVSVGKGAVNILISIINSMIDLVVRGLNLLSFNVPSWVPGIGGNRVGFNIQKAPQIPYLAQGAVIPPNAPFAAVLGDQRHGNNIEAPEDLIRKIVREETGGSGGVDVNISFDGDLAQLIRLLAPKITAQQKKTDRALGV